MRGISILMVVLGLVATFAFAAEDEGKPNCKLTTQTLFKDGKKKLEIDEIYTPSRQVCSAEAETRRLTISEEDEEVGKKVVFSWMERK